MLVVLKCNNDDRFYKMLSTQILALLIMILLITVNLLLRFVGVYFETVMLVDVIRLV